MPTVMPGPRRRVAITVSVIRAAAWSMATRRCEGRAMAGIRRSMRASRQGRCCAVAGQGFVAAVFAPIVTIAAIAIIV